MQAKSKRRRQSWPSHQTTPDADSGEIYLVGDSVTSDNLQRKEKTKSCRRGKKNGWRWKKKKKRRKKQQWEAGSKKASISANPRLQVCGMGSGWDNSSRDLRVRSTYRARESKGSWQCRDPGCSRVGLLQRHQHTDVLKVRAASRRRLQGHGRWPCGSAHREVWISAQMVPSLSWESFCSLGQ